jgi:hypothetical protein
MQDTGRRRMQKQIPRRPENGLCRDDNAIENQGRRKRAGRMPAVREPACNAGAQKSAASRRFQQNFHRLRRADSVEINSSRRLLLAFACGICRARENICRAQLRETTVPIALITGALAARSMALPLAPWDRSSFLRPRADFALWKNCESREERASTIRIIFSCCSRRI